MIPRATPGCEPGVGRQPDVGPLVKVPWNRKWCLQRYGPSTVNWVLFDLNGTLLDPAAIAGPLGAPASLGDEVLDDAVWQATAGTLAGDYRPLPEYLRAALERRVQIDGLERSGIDDALEVARTMPPYPDAAGALQTLRDGGLSVGVLTNSAGQAAQFALEAAGLRELVDLVVGSDEVEAYKPDPRVYAHGAVRANAAPGEIVLVAAHWWDVMGAKRAGMHTGWVGRRERVLLSSVPAPDFSGEDLASVAASIAAT